MTDTSQLSHVAEDLIAHHLQRSGLRVENPKSDQLGTDLLVFAQITDAVKFCSFQCKGRTVSKTGAKVVIPALHVTPGYVLFMQRHARDDHAILAARHALYLGGRELKPARWSGGTRNWSPFGSVTLNPERDIVIKTHLARHHSQPQAA